MSTFVVYFISCSKHSMISVDLFIRIRYNFFCPLLPVSILKRLLTDFTEFYRKFVICLLAVAVVSVTGLMDISFICNLIFAVIANSFGFTVLWESCVFENF